MTVAPQQNFEPASPQYPAPGRPAAVSPYPTAPPWAAPPAAPAAYQPAPTYQYGQLLVPYPEEMINAARPKPPSWVPVVIYTFFFGMLALISVTGRARQARRGRNSVAPYWVAWGLTTVLGFFAWVAVGAVATPLYLQYREGAVTESVQSAIVRDGALQRIAGVTATAATCTPKADRGVDGLRAYDCALTLDDGRKGTLLVTADSSGNWRATAKR